MGYAFISYSEKQRPEAERLRQLLNAHDIKTWMAPYDLPQEAAYADVIHQAIREASCFVLLLRIPERTQKSFVMRRE